MLSSSRWDEVPPTYIKLCKDRLNHQSEILSHAKELESSKIEIRQLELINGRLYTMLSKYMNKHDIEERLGSLPVIDQQSYQPLQINMYSLHNF